MNTIKVKICGIRSLLSAQTAIAAGADYIGFNFILSSNRYIRPEDAQKISKKITGKVLLVGIFQNTPISEVEQIRHRVHLDFIQLHGEEDNNYIKQINAPVIKSISNSIQENFSFPENVAYLLLDVPKNSTETILTRGKPYFYPLPTFVAGGVTIENVVQVITRFSPFGVDIARGVETNGKEDVEKIKKFIRKVKSL